MSGLTRVLLVGINYTGTRYSLAGCINDALNMRAHLQTLFPACKNYKLLTDNTAEKPTRASILKGIQWLVADLKSGENVLFHYSGHGGRVRDVNGDEVSGMDSCIYPLNGRKMEEITDDEIRSQLAEKIPKGCKCFVIFDACHSGTAVDLRCTFDVPSESSILFTEDLHYRETVGDVLFLSGCRDTEYSMDTVDMNNNPSGAMTMALLASWKKYGAAFTLKNLLWDVRRFLKEYGYTQIPQLSAGSCMSLHTPFDLNNNV
jgi:metacaspase-1